MLKPRIAFRPRSGSPDALRSRPEIHPRSTTRRTTRTAPALWRRPCPPWLLDETSSAAWRSSRERMRAASSPVSRRSCRTSSARRSRRSGSRVRAARAAAPGLRWRSPRCAREPVFRPRPFRIRRTRGSGHESLRARVEASRWRPVPTTFCRRYGQRGPLRAPDDDGTRRRGRRGGDPGVLRLRLRVWAALPIGTEPATPRRQVYTHPRGSTYTRPSSTMLLAIFGLNGGFGVAVSLLILFLIVV